MSPHRAVLILTPPNHPAAYLVYGAQVIIGIALTTGLITIVSLQALLLLPVVGVIMTAGGAVACYAITIVPKAVRKDPPLRLEQVSAWVVGAINALFSVALFLFYPLNAAVPTKVYVTGVAVAAIMRAVQIRRQRRLLRAAYADPAPVPVIAVAEGPNPDR